VLGSQAPSRRAFPRRPASFAISPLGRYSVMEGCTQPRAHLNRFRDSGRLLYAWAMFGPHPTPSIRHRVRAIPNGLRIARPASG
jgi:hypothetical protein